MGALWLGGFSMEAGISTPWSPSLDRDGDDTRPCPSSHLGSLTRIQRSERMHQVFTEHLLCAWHSSRPRGGHRHLLFREETEAQHKKAEGSPKAPQAASSPTPTLPQAPHSGFTGAGEGAGLLTLVSSHLISQTRNPRPREAKWAALGHAAGRKASEVAARASTPPASGVAVLHGQQPAQTGVISVLGGRKPGGGQEQGGG